MKLTLTVFISFHYEKKMNNNWFTKELILKVKYFEYINLGK